MTVVHEILILSFLTNLAFLKLLKAKFGFSQFFAPGNPVLHWMLLPRWFLGENKIVDLEEELRQIGENLKALEVAEEKAQQREEEFKRQMKVLIDRLKTAESR